MKTGTIWIVGLLLIAGAALGGYWFGHRGATGKEKEDEPASRPAKAEDKPVAAVGVMPLMRGRIAAYSTAYGSVVAPANEVRVVSAPFECRVTRVRVTPGQTVREGDLLIEVEGSAATALMVQEAMNTLSAAERDLELVKERFQQKLATNTDLNAAQNAERAAQGRLSSLQQAGAGGPRQLKADAPGVVSKVDVQIGQVVAIGSPLVEVAAQNKIQVKLSVDPRDAQLLKIGQDVQLNPVDNSAARPVEGKIQLIAARIDPATRLTEVIVWIAPDAGLMLDSFVSARLTLESADALIVPRNAVLPGDSGEFTLFTVKDSKAVKHVVRIGIENDEQTAVICNDLGAGMSVVVVGNYVLEDGMPVDAYPAPLAGAGGPESGPSPAADAEPAATEPATLPAAPPAERTTATAPAEGRS